MSDDVDKTRRQQENTAMTLMNDEEARRTWLKLTADMIYRVWFTGDVNGNYRFDKDERTAATVARQALTYLATPPETVQVIVKRQPFQLAVMPQE